jgi:hypothetical protein
VLRPQVGDRRAAHRLGAGHQAASQAGGFIDEQFAERWFSEHGGARAHNRWLAEQCSRSPERRAGVAVVPMLGDVDVAVAESLERQSPDFGAGS